MTISYGQSLLRRYLEIVTNTFFYENYRPDFMKGLELDFYFPNEKVAYEFNGDQHYYETPSFGSPDRQIRNDSYKKLLCTQNGITLIIIEASTLDPVRIRHKTKNKGLLGNRIYKQVTKDSTALLKAYSDDVKKYVKVLRKNFNSPTAYKAGSDAKMKVVLENCGMEIITADDAKAIKRKARSAKRRATTIRVKKLHAEQKELSRKGRISKEVERMKKLLDNQSLSATIQVGPMQAG